MGPSMNRFCLPGEKCACGKPAAVEIAGVIYCASCYARHGREVHQKLQEEPESMLYDYELGTYRPVVTEEDLRRRREDIERERYRSQGFSGLIEAEKKLT